MQLHHLRQQMCLIAGCISIKVEIRVVGSVFHTMVEMVSVSPGGASVIVLSP